MLTLIVLIILGALGVGFLIVFIKDFIIHKKELEPEASWVHTSIMGAVVNFFDTLGIGSFAPTTAWLRISKQVRDKIIPGTLNVACCIPVILEALLFIREVSVEPVTLFTMLVASTVGAYLGAGIVARLPEQKIRLFMGIALLVTGFLMLAGMLNWMPSGGEAVGLTGAKLIIAIVASFVLGALMTAGIGLYAPCMALVYLLGMSPLVAFPIMMGSCAMLMPVASFKFIKEGAYSRKTSMAFTFAGALGVFIAVYLVISLPLTILRWLVIAVLVYTSASLIWTYARTQREEKAQPAQA
ncbi:MAG: sulfite exporter TauE/SafE family protein [Treponema sp.]|jgi:uncharacterized membrane protein YfcA|nr:sulfite exporter TauE/SafE family protein [Treponema sp.]